jgi:hypothetical protein
MNYSLQKYSSLATLIRFVSYQVAKREDYKYAVINTDNRSDRED